MKRACPEPEFEEVRSAVAITVVRGTGGREEVQRGEMGPALRRGEPEGVAGSQQLRTAQVGQCLAIGRLCHREGGGCFIPIGLVDVGHWRGGIGLTVRSGKDCLQVQDPQIGGLPDGQEQVGQRLQRCRVLEGSPPHGSPPPGRTHGLGRPVVHGPGQVLAQEQSGPGPQEWQWPRTIAYVETESQVLSPFRKLAFPIGEGG